MFEVIWHIRYEDIDSVVNGCTQDYTLQFQYDKDFRKRKFIVLCFEK